MQKTNPLGGRASWLKYHVEHFYLLDVDRIVDQTNIIFCNN